jgi:hypothetical protein
MYALAAAFFMLMAGDEGPEANPFQETLWVSCADAPSPLPITPISGIHACSPNQ